MSASVLIVEDHSSIREPLAALLRLKGHVVLEAEDGKDALAQLKMFPNPGLILLDLMMPVMDGWTFLDRKSRDPAIARIPVVILSAVSNLHPPRQTPDIVATVEKPIDMVALLANVDKYCNAGFRLAASF